MIKDTDNYEETRENPKRTILNTFTDLAVSLRECSNEDELANAFLSKFIDLIGVTAGAIYLKTKSEKGFAFAAQFGFPEDVLPLRKTEQEPYDGIDNLIQSPVWEMGDKHKDDFGKLNIKLLTTARLRTKDQTNGLLIVGWDSVDAVSSEVEEAILAICTLLGIAIDGVRVYSDLEKAHVDSIVIINKLVAVVDKFGKGHSTRVAQISEAIAAELGLKQEQLNLVYEAGIVHDVGRICIPPEILNKPGKLTESEYAIVKEHPRVGAELIAPLSIYKKLVPAILYHHERLDGSGYPEGLDDAQIPLFARIIAVADVYDAMTCDRAYRSALGSEHAISALQDGRGVKYDSDVVDALIRVIKQPKKVASWI